MPTEVLDRDLGLDGRYMFQYFDAHDKVELFVEFLSDGGEPAKWLDRFVHTGDRVRRHIDAKRVDTPRAERFDEKPHGAPGVEHTGRRDVGHDAVGDPREERRPLVGALVGGATTQAKVPRIERCGADTRRIERRWL